MKLIVACDPKGGIGYQNKLPWPKIENDLPRFKKYTTGKVILMGYNTWESLPKRPLPNRINVVVTRKIIPNITTFSSMPDKDTMDLSDVWLIGGAKLIESSWHLIQEVYLTKTFANYTCDSYIDLVKLEKFFTRKSIEVHDDHTFEIYHRK